MNNIPLQEQVEIDNTDSCNICKRSFKRDDKLIRDHCHITGKKWFGAAHTMSNFSYKEFFNDYFPKFK